MQVLKTHVTKISRSVGAVLGGAALAAALGGVATAKTERAPGMETSIPFANSYGIRDFRADGNRALWIEGRGGQWYRAELMGYCPGLRHAWQIGIDTGGTSRLDKFGRILVDGQRCPISSLVTSADPKKDKPGKRAS